MEGDFVEAAGKAKELMKEKRGKRLVGAFAPATEETDGTTEVPGVVSETVEGPDLGESLCRAESALTKEGDRDKPVAESRPSPTSQPNAEEEGEVIYLTSDSPYTLDRLKPYSTYIIGGLVDKNRHKGICYKTACDKGIKTAKLPIGEYMEMQSRFILATNHVVEIMVRWLECGNWGDAFMKVMPKRKGGKLREAGGAEYAEQNQDGIALLNSDDGNGSLSSVDEEVMCEARKNDNTTS